MDDFKRFFVRGLAALVPTILTIALLVWAYRIVNDNVATFITGGLLHFCSWVSDEPATWLMDPKTLNEDALKYGTPLDVWDEQGRRLTIQYSLITNFQRIQERTGDESGQIGAKGAAAARRAKTRAVWEITFVKYKLHLLGFLIAVVLVYFIGFFLASFIGRASWRAGERLLYRIPLIRAVYPNIKQVTDFLLSERKVEFSGVVAVEYPRRGVWSLGLRTGSPMKAVQRVVPDELVTVFIPSSPTPVTGYVIQVPHKDVIELNMTIDEGFRFTISGGVIKPDSPFPAALDEESEPEGG